MKQLEALKLYFYHQQWDDYQKQLELTLPLIWSHLNCLLKRTKCSIDCPTNSIELGLIHYFAFPKHFHLVEKEQQRELIHDAFGWRFLSNNTASVGIALVACIEITGKWRLHSGLRFRLKREETSLSKSDYVTIVSLPFTLLLRFHNDSCFLDLVCTEQSQWHPLIPQLLLNGSWLSCLTIHFQHPLLYMLSLPHDHFDSKTQDFLLRYLMHFQRIPQLYSESTVIGWWRGWLFPDRFHDFIRLQPVMPLIKCRKCVIFIHGFISEPYIWLEMMKTFFVSYKERQLYLDYEIFYFQYPTGLPLLTIARELRYQIRRLIQRRSFSEVILIGHSLGGMLSRLCCISGSHELMHQVLGDRPLPAEQQEPLWRSLFLWDPIPEVSTIFCIATPHHGFQVSRLKVWFALNTIHLPTWISETGKERRALAQNFVSLTRDAPLIQYLKTAPLSCKRVINILGDASQSPQPPHFYWTAPPSKNEFSDGLVDKQSGSFVIQAPKFITSGYWQEFIVGERHVRILECPELLVLCCVLLHQL